MPSQVCTGDPIADALCQTASGIGSSVFAAGATSALDATSAWVATGASWFLAQVGGALGSSTAIDLSAPWFLERYRAIEALLASAAAGGAPVPVSPLPANPWDALEAAGGVP